MMAGASGRIALNEVRWPSLEPVAADRVIDGAPATATIVIGESYTAQTGFWHVTPV
jgi:hypothetical protein